MRTPNHTQLDELGHNRINFKHHIILYLVLNTIFWMIWYVTGSGYIWPIWPTGLGAIAVLFHYMQAWGE